MSKINYHDYYEQIYNMNNSGECGVEKNYLKRSFTGFQPEDNDNYWAELYKLILNQGNLIHQQQYLIDILSGMNFISPSTCYFKSKSKYM